MNGVIRPEKFHVKLDALHVSETISWLGWSPSGHPDPGMRGLIDPYLSIQETSLGGSLLQVTNMLAVDEL